FFAIIGFLNIVTGIFPESSLTDALRTAYREFSERVQLASMLQDRRPSEVFEKWFSTPALERRRILTPEVVHDLMLVGRPGELVTRIKALQAAGVTQINTDVVLDDP